MPILSIITPCFNRSGFISGAIESVLAQKFSDFEHIIVDGGSTDGTLDMLRRYRHLKVISEPDHGMYDALNKGMRLARGEWVGFLNSDDLYADGCFGQIEEHFEKTNILAVVGKAVIFKDHPGGAPEIVGNFSPKNADLLELATIGSPFFNAWFFKKSVFKIIGNFNDVYRIAADRDFMLRFALRGLKYEPLDVLVYWYRHHEGAMTFDVSDEKLEKIVKEHIRMTNSYLRNDTIASRARRLIRDSRTQDTLEMGVRAIKRGKPIKFLSYLLAGSQYDPLWMLKFVKRAMKKALS
jgi:glycosyltransferase involved in cell wall biosynthesis